MRRLREPQPGNAGGDTAATVKRRVNVMPDDPDRCLAMPRCLSVFGLTPSFYPTLGLELITKQKLMLRDCRGKMSHDWTSGEWNNPIMKLLNCVCVYVCVCVYFTVHEPMKFIFST